ncbi:MAG: CBS domain-containing protein [Acidobacteriota bacterium]
MKKVQDVMTRNVKPCWINDNLARAAAIMWENDCGVVPVVNDNGNVIGMITDRDICMAVALKNSAPTEIIVSDIMSTNVHACSLNDDVKDALKTMQNARVRRIPVVGDDGRLQGILSLNDIILQAEETRGRGVSDIPYENIVNTLKTICEHRASKAAVA